MVQSLEQRRSLQFGASLAGTVWFMTESRWAKRHGQPGVMDLALGNPQEMPVPGFAAALQQQSEPHSTDWFAYKVSEPEAQEVAAASLLERTGLSFAPVDVAMTNGAFAALAIALKTLTTQGDEVIFNLPPWMCYEMMIHQAGATPVKVNVAAEDYDLDLAAIEAAITPSTRVVIVNSPHNPTGRIYPRETLAKLADLLERASRNNGRRIYILSDEAYARIVFDGHRAVSPAETYPYTLISYTWGKQLLTPGQRIGYLALSPDMPERVRQELRADIFLNQLGLGFAFPNALLQHALADLEKLSIDVPHFQQRRDRMVAALREIGYEVNSPEGTFYLLATSPIPDDRHFVEMLADRDVFVLPGAFCEIPGHFRISLTASDDMIDRSLPHFEAVYQQCQAAEARIA